jgi:competence protein ComEC
VAAIGVLPALSLLLGATVGLNTSIDARTCAWCLPLTCAGALALWHRRSAIALLPLVLGFLAGGIVLAAEARERALHATVRQVLDHEFGGAQIASIGPIGRHDPLPSRFLLIEDASPRDGFVSLRAAVVAVRVHGQWRKVEGGLAISVNGSAADDRVMAWRAGRVLEAPVTFRRPARYLNEGVRDFEREMALDGVTLLGTIKSGLLIDVVDAGGVVSEAAADVRAHVRGAVARWIEPHNTISAAVASAVLIGDRTGLPDETRDALQAAGTYHVIAISGGNIAILATAASCVFLIVGVRGRRAACAAIVVLCVYAVIVTAGPSVWRATLMAVLYFWARAMDHRGRAGQTVAAAAAAIIVARPLDVRDAGFILTFGATVALLEGARIGARLTPRARFLSWIAASVFASLAVELALFPVSASLFSRVTGAGLVLNLAAVPLMGVVQISALVAAAADRFAPVAGPAGWVASIAAQGLVDSASLVTLAPWSTARVPPPGGFVIAIYYAALAAMCLSTSGPARAIGAVAWGGAALVIAGIADPQAIHSRQPGSILRITMLDVGQGESILIEPPGDRRLLIDTGGTPFGGSAGVGARVIAPALWARGIRALDAVLVTHGDPDHLGGAIDVLADFRPRQLWMGVPVPRHRLLQGVDQTAHRLAIPVRYRRSGETMVDEHLEVRVLHPPAPDWERRRVRNDDSVVVEIVYRDVAVLLTGDISAEVERTILPRLTRAGTRILKVAHHGSRTSSSLEFLSEWRPQWALISAGRGNTFGHPTPDVLQRLDAIGARVLRTDLHGEITIQTDGYNTDVRTFRGQADDTR